MNRLNGKSSYDKLSHLRNIWSAGEIAQKGNYVCVHCNSHTALEHTGHLPLCRRCYGRRFKQV